MTFWNSAVERFCEQVRAEYPPGADGMIAEGRRRFEAMGTEDRFETALGVRVLLRAANAFFADPKSMRRVFGAFLQGPATLFALDDLLARFPSALKCQRPGEPEDPQTLDPLRVVHQLNMLQYEAEMQQDVLVGIREPD